MIAFLLVTSTYVVQTWALFYLKILFEMFQQWQKGKFRLSEIISEKVNL